MWGPKIQASAVATVRHGLPLSDASGPVEVALIGFVAPLASLTLPAVRAFAMALVVAALFAICTQLAFGSLVVLSYRALRSSITMLAVVP